MYAAIAFAALQTWWDIESNVFVASEYGLQVLDYATKTIEITTFDFGTLQAGQSFVTQPIAVKNVGNDATWIGWNATNLPSGFTLVCREQDGGAYISQNVYDALGSTAAGAFWGGDLARFCFNLTNVNSAPGSYSFTIKILGADSSTG